MAARPKITVVGAGNVGATVAQYVVEKELGDVVLVDVIEGIPQGKALDLAQAGPVHGYDCRLTGENELRDLPAKLPNQVTIDLSGVTRINSAGVREWLSFIRALPANTTLVLERCPVIFVDLLNIIREFAGPATVRSVFVPHLCKQCKAPQDCLVGLPLNDQSLPSRDCCERCGSALELDVDNGTFFAFLELRNAIG